MLTLPRMGWFWHFPWNCREVIERNERIVLEDQLRRALAELAEARAELAEARAETIRAHTKVTDFFARTFMKNGVFEPGPVATEPAHVDLPIPRGRRQARDIIREQTIAAERELAEWQARQSQSTDDPRND